MPVSIPPPAPGDRARRVFEVDTPTTQADKRLATDELLPPRTGTDAVWGPGDLEPDSLRELLPRNGFRPGTTTSFEAAGIVCVDDEQNSVVERAEKQTETTVVSVASFGGVASRIA